MKNYFAYGFLILGAVATVFFMRMGRPTVDMNTAGVSEAPVDQLPPAPSAENAAYINRTRLDKMASADYKGPSYKENYNTPELMMAAKARATGRLPAAADEAAPAEKANPTQESK